MSLKPENGRRKILVVDDDPQVLRMVEAALSHDGYEVATVGDAEGGIAKIRSWKPHLVLLDVSMPGFDGIHTLLFLRQSPEYISTLFLSAKSSVEDVVRGLDAGADDYICKPF